MDRHKIQHIVSPYEAAPQLTYMLKCDKVKAVITENSNLLAFGCSNVIFKMARTGEGIQISCKDIFNRYAGITNSEKLRYLCILSGCDYLSSLPGIGLRKALSIIKERKTLDNILQLVQNRSTKEYSERFVKADAAFLYQFVFNSTSRTYVRLNPLPEDIKIEHLSGLGESPQNREIPLLKSNIAIHVNSNRVLKESTDPFVQLNPSEFNEFEFDDCALQEMELLLKQVEPVVERRSPTLIPTSSKPSIKSSSSKPSSSRMAGPRYNSPAYNVKSPISSASQNVNKNDTRTNLTCLLIQSGYKPPALKGKTPERKPFFRARSPPPSPPLSPPRPPQPQSSSEPAIDKNNVGPVTPSKQQVNQKRKSPTGNSSSPFEKLKKAFVFEDVSVARHGLPPPQTSPKPVVCKEKQKPAPKRKSLMDNSSNPFEKVKKSFVFSDVSAARRGVSKK